LLSHEEIESFRDDGREQGQRGPEPAAGGAVTGRGAAVLTASLRLNAAWLRSMAPFDPTPR